MKSNNYKIEKVVCLICGYETNNHQSFNSHIAHAHHIKSKDYYDTYIKTSDDGICKTCGKPTSFMNMWSGYRTYCCNSCMSSNKDIQNQRKQTSLLHYGVEFPHQSQEVKDKMANTCLAKYGVTNVYASEYVKQLNKENAGQRRLKEIQTRTINGTRSTVEMYFKEKLEANNIEYIEEYSTDERYPFPCDFYLPKTDTFIELNFYWMHGEHWFDNTNSDDMHKLNIWKEKATNSSQYYAAINIWTKHDILRKHTAETNKLNYIVLWNIQDIEDFILHLEHFH